MKRLITAFGLITTIVLTTACASTPPVPVTRKLSPEAMQKVSEMDVVISENTQGIQASWTSAGAAQPGYTDYTYLAPPGTSPIAAGIGGAIGQAIAVAMLDAAPSARARRSVQTINTGLSTEKLNTSLQTAIENAMDEGQKVRINDVNVVSFEEDDSLPSDKLRLLSSYTLAEDASAVRIRVDAAYYSDSMPYQTRYTYESDPPKSERTGPIYQNRFTYHSDRFDAPALNDDVRAELIAAINSQYEGDLAGLEEGDEKTLKKITKVRDKGLKGAEDDKLSKTEKATLLISKWRGGGSVSPLLMDEVEKAHAYIAKMLVKDLNNSEIPQFERVKEVKSGLFGPAVIEDEVEFFLPGEDDRQYTKITSGYYAGSYVSFPSNGMATYGNTYKVVRDED